MSTTVKILLGALVAIVIVACIAAVAVWLLNRGGDEAAGDPLTGTHWQVRSYYSTSEAGGMASPLAGTQLTAQFADGSLNGSAGCNTYNATYTVDGDSLSISLPAVDHDVLRGARGHHGPGVGLPERPRNPPRALNWKPACSTS